MLQLREWSNFQLNLNDNFLVLAFVLKVIFQSPQILDIIIK